MEGCIYRFRGYYSLLVDFWIVGSGWPRLGYELGPGDVEQAGRVMDE